MNMLSNGRKQRIAYSIFVLVVTGILCPARAMESQTPKIHSEAIEIFNADFEGYSPWPWTQTGTAKAKLSLEKTPGMAFESKKCLKIIPASSKNGQPVGMARIFPFYTAYGGKTFKLSCAVRGRGKACLVVMQYLIDKKSWHNKLVSGEELELTESWQTRQLLFTVTDPRITRIAVGIQVTGKDSEGLLDSVSLELIQTNNAELTFSPAFQQTAAGRKIVLNAAMSENGSAAGKHRLIVRHAAFAAEKTEELQLLTNTSGKASLNLAAPSAEGYYCLAASSPESMAGAQAIVEIINEQDLVKLEKMAKKAAFDSDFHFVVIGDSLSDYFRGHNYVDRLGFWLGRYSRGRVSFENFGVGGDYFARVRQRLQSPSTTYRGGMYADLLKRQTDLVIIALGANDTKYDLNKTPHTTYTPPEDLPELFADVVREIRKRSEAEILVISAPALVVETCRTRADKLAAAGKSAIYFGDPDKVEAFNAELQKLAHRFDCTYLDTYSELKNHPKQKDLFGHDGIHLNSSGNRFLSELLLKYFASKKQ